MSYMYRSSFANGGGRGGQKSSRWLGVAKIVGIVVLAVGLFAVLVWWFRKDATPEVALDTVEDASSEANEISLAAAGPLEQTVELTALMGQAASGSATRSDIGGVFSLTMVAELPIIDNATTAYEVWFVKPGITDFFTLGELFSREDGKWGLAWQVSDALARPDILEFNRVLVTREARDGNTAPSANQVLQGTFE